jgi:hypothetical protein
MPRPVAVPVRERAPWRPVLLDPREPRDDLRSGRRGCLPGHSTGFSSGWRASGLQRNGRHPLRLPGWHDLQVYVVSRQRRSLSAGQSTALELLFAAFGRELPAHGPERRYELRSCWARMHLRRCLWHQGSLRERTLDLDSASMPTVMSHRHGSARTQAFQVGKRWARKAS